MQWTPPDPPGRPAATPRHDRGRRRLFIALGALFAVLLLLLLADRLAVAYAQNTIATEVKKEGFGAKPDVSIKGFPFLTQVAGRNFKHATMSARNLQTGPLKISSIDVSARGVKTNSGFTAGTIGSVNGTAMVSFGDLAAAADQPGLKLSAAGPGKVKLNVDLGIVDGEATAKVIKQGNGIRVFGVTTEGVPLEDLGDVAGLGDLGKLDFTVPVSGLPLGLVFESLNVTSKGIAMHVTGKNVKFSE